MPKSIDSVVNWGSSMQTRCADLSVTNDFFSTYSSAHTFKHGSEEIKLSRTIEWHGLLLWLNKSKSVPGDKIWELMPIKIIFFFENFARLKVEFRLIMANFAKVYRRLQPPPPPSSLAPCHTNVAICQKVPLYNPCDF